MVIKEELLFISKTRDLDQGDVIIFEKRELKVVQRVLEIDEAKAGLFLYTKTDYAPIVTDEDIILLEPGKKDNYYLGKVWLKI